MINNFKLEELPEHLSETLDRSFSEVMFKACIVCFDSQNHRTGVSIAKYEDANNLYAGNLNINWQTEITPPLTNTFNDINRTTDYGAMCIALILALNLSDYSYFMTSKTGTGFDFWLTNDPYGVNFEARLEISGIRTGSSTNNIKLRQKLKEKQLKQSDHLGLSTFISITEFSNPEALFLSK